MSRPATASEMLSDPGHALARLQSGTGGTLRFDFDGVLLLPQTIVIATDTTVDASGRNVTLDGGESVRHFVVTNGAALRLIGLKLVNGRCHNGGPAPEPGTSALGGAILNLGSTLELIECGLFQNRALGAAGSDENDGAAPGLQPGMRGGAAFGGAIYSINGRLSVTGCQFGGNIAAGGTGATSRSGYTGGGGDAFGGAVYATNTPTVFDGVTLSNNVAQAGEMSAGRPLEGGGSGYGGALATEAGTLSVTACVFVANQAQGATKVASDQSRQTGLAQGGAFFHSSGIASVDTSLFATNSSVGGLGAERGAQIVFGDGLGGAVYSRGDLQIRNSAFVSNTADAGDVPPDCCSPLTAQAGASAGGALVSEGFLEIINSTLSGNRASGGASSSVGAFSGTAHGGAVAVWAGASSFLNVTLSENRVDTTNPRKAFGSSVAVVTGQAAFTNTILFASPGETNVSGTILDGGHNICSDGSAHFTLPSSHNSLDPLLGALQYSGGLTPTVRLLAASPAVDAGDPLASPPTDQRGVPRPMGLASDIGAFELVPKVTLARSADGMVTIHYAFRAKQTNLVSASTNLRDWALVGTAVSDENGSMQFEDRAATQPPEKFYRISAQAITDD